MSEVIEYSPMLARRVRTGDWPDQAISTFAKVREQIEAKDLDAITRLTGYCADECKICVDIMRQWQADLRILLGEKGMQGSEIAALDERLVKLLATPDGEPYDSPRSWYDYLERLGDIDRAAGHGDWGGAAATLDATLDHWRVMVGREADHTYGIMSELVERCGEQVVPEMYDRILGPLFSWRYKRFDISRHDWETECLPILLYVALEAERAWLSTTWRDGEPLELIEYEDRWVMRFDPCGTGGRALRGDWVEDTPSRIEPPYNFKVIEGAYDWTDGMKGVCVYCNHCQVLMEHMPMDAFGYPLRVVEPPLYPDDDRGEGRQKCQWTMYKDPTTAPESVYARCGRTKPSSFGSEA
jgi:hypothetical protein